MTSEEFENAIRKIIDADEDGLRLIYEAYMPYVFSAILRIVGVKQDAEDLSADFFIKLWQIAPSYNFGGMHKAWMSTIARNLALDFVRRRSKIELTDEMPEHADVSATGNFSDIIINDMALAQALEHLSESEREIIHMKIIADMTFKEIAETLSTPMGTITWKYQNAIKKLRKFGYE